MARILYGALVTALRGSIGGLTFHGNASGQITRLKPNRVQLRSTGQNKIRTNFGQAVNAWASLNLTQQQAWATMAAAHPKIDNWGVTRTISGYQYFMSCYNYALLLNITKLLSPAAYESPLATPVFTLAFGASQLDITWAGGFAHARQNLLIYATPPLMANGVKNRKYLRFLQAVPGGTSTTISILAYWKSVFGFSAVPSPGTGRYFIQISVQTLNAYTQLNGTFNSISFMLSGF